MAGSSHLVLGLHLCGPGSCSSGTIVPGLLKVSKSLNSARAVSSLLAKRRNQNSYTPKAFFNPEDEPLVKEALKEPIAFFGGVFAGLLRLDLNEDPLREWIARTAEAAGIKAETSDKKDEGSPEEIQIE